MKLVLQRVSESSVKVDGETISSIKHGLLILLGVEQRDEDKDAEFLAQKAAELRIFADNQGKMNLSLKEVNGAVLLVSQFTLLADCRKGRRPSFIQAAAPQEGERLYLYFAECLRKLDVPVELGRFGADMKVSLLNNGPVTIIMESRWVSNH
jgi:D-tyrosyl-tRNA(Tyr) deacylase